jgi:hypothetical protein
MADIEFVNGLTVNAPREGAPDFVKASISIKTADLMAWLQGKYEAGDEWVNVDVKESRGGKWYCSVNAYKPNNLGTKPGNAPNNGQSAPADESDVPF